MKIYGYFKDNNNDTVSVTIYNINKTGADININTCDWIEFADDPVEISTDCDDSFVHIIKKTCKIQLKSQRWLGEYLFANNATSIVVNVKRRINNVTTCLFAGFVTPCSYNQDYANAWETITINCIDNLGAMEYRNQNDEKTWTQLKAESKMRTFKELLDRMKLRDTTMIIDNMPETTAQMMEAWVETGYERQIDNNGNITYYAVETRVKELDENTAVTTTDTRLGRQLTPDYRPSEETVVDNGTVYYKDYAWVEVNGTYVKTNNWILGDPVTTGIPTVTETERVLDGWSYGAHIMPFEYYEHFRLNYVMSDGSVKYGTSDTIGDRIPEAPSKTTLGSYYEMREAGIDDLDYDDTTGFYYYKNYAWIIMNFGMQMHLYKTGDWVRGQRYLTINDVNSFNVYGKVDTSLNECPVFYINGDKYIADYYDSQTRVFGVSDAPFKIDSFKIEQVSHPVYGTSERTFEELYFNFDTTNLTDMDQFLARQYNLKIVDLTTFNTSNVTNMQGLFIFDSRLEVFNISNFDTSSVTNMAYMFSQMFGRGHGVTSFDLSNFNTSSVTNMECMFWSDGYLISLNLSNFDMTNVTNYNAMFNGNNNMTTLVLNNVNNTTFNKIISSAAALPTTVTIYRDNDVYKYDDNTNTWVITNNAD